MPSISAFIFREAEMTSRDNVPEARGLPVKGVRELPQVAHIALDTMLARLIYGLMDQHVFETLDGCPGWTG